MNDHTSSRLTVQTWDGNNINDGVNFRAKISLTGDGPNNRKSSAVMTRRIGGSPTYVRQQPVEQVYTLSVSILNDSYDNVNQLRKWFDSAYGPKYLVVVDEDGASWRLFGLPETVSARNARALNWIITIRSDTGIWESNSTEEDSASITTSGDTVTLTNEGNAIVYPTLTLSPNEVMDAGDGWTKRRRIHIANKSDAALSDPIGDGYPVDIGEDALDTDALNTAGKLQSDLDDLRLWLSGDFINRWPDPSSDNTTSKIWTNLQMRGKKTITNTTAMTDSSPANGESIAVNNATGTAGWPERGAVKFGSEVILYNGKGGDGRSLLDITRGARNTTAAAHSGSTTGYWVEHLFFDMLYGYSAAVNPAPPDDRKPVIDLALSTNTKHVWSSLFLNDGDRRSRAWQRIYTEDNPIARFMTGYQSGGDLTFQDLEPTGDKPRYNNVEMVFPIPIAASAAAVELDRTIGLNLAHRIYLTDKNGIETLLDGAICQAWTPTAESNKQFTPGSTSYRMRMNAKHAAVTGARFDSVTPTSTSVSAQDFEVHQILHLDNDSFLDAMQVRIGGLTAGEVIDLIMRIPSENPDGDTAAQGGMLFQIVTMVGSAGNVGGGGWVNFLFSSRLAIPSGDVMAGVGYDTSGADTFSMYSIQDIRKYARGSLKSRTGSAEAWSTNFDDTALVVLISKDTEPQDDAPNKTGDSLTINDIEITLDSTYTPDIDIGAEEDVVFVQARITNESTGDFLDIEYPMAVGEDITIDCMNKRVIDGETGLDIPFVIFPSNPVEWLTLLPGDNDISITWLNMPSTQLGWSFRHRKLG